MKRRICSFGTGFCACTEYRCTRHSLSTHRAIPLLQIFRRKLAFALVFSCSMKANLSKLSFDQYENKKIENGCILLYKN